MTAASNVPYRWLTWVAAAAQVAIGVVPYLVSGLVAPLYGVLFLWAVWVAASVLLWRLRDRPRRAVLVPPGALAAWVLVVNLGDVLLGWTA